MSDTPENYTPPSVELRAFHCPHCRVFARQLWYVPSAANHGQEKAPPLPNSQQIENLLSRQKESLATPAGLVLRRAIHTVGFERYAELRRKKRPVLSSVEELDGEKLENAWLSCCDHCYEVAIWVWDRLVWPPVRRASPPNQDMPGEVQKDYEEASEILDQSPRGAAALLRLSIENLCNHLNVSGNSLNDKIASLVRKGLPEQIQQALDTVRVIGNNAVHPGQMDLHDDRKTAESLFELVNLIVDSMISQPKRVSSLFDKLPQNARDQIERRDARR